MSGAAGSDAASVSGPFQVTYSRSIRARQPIMKTDNVKVIDVYKTYQDIFVDVRDSKDAIVPNQKLCLLCARVCTLTGRTSESDKKTCIVNSSSTSSNLVSHITRMHACELTDICAAVNGPAGVLKAIGAKSTAAVATLQNQSSMPGFLKVGGPPDGFDLTTELALFTTMDARPFNTIGGDGFKKLYDAANLQQYFKSVLPHPKTVAHRAVLIDEGLQWLASVVFPRTSATRTGRTRRWARTSLSTPFRATPGRAPAARPHLASTCTTSRHRGSSRIPR